MGAENMELVRRLGISVLLGALIGLQREQANSRLGGVRTFPLVCLLGAFAGFLSSQSVLPVAAGLLALMGLAVIKRDKKETGSITTEIALLATYLIGAYAAQGSLTLATIAGGTVAVLLQFKPELHGAVEKLSREDMRAIMRFAVLVLIILPILPNQAYGPEGTLNPRESWLMVVLVVGLNLAGFIAYKFVGKRGGLYAAGLLGGLISSTATAFGYSNLAGRHARLAPMAGAVVAMACAVVYVRIMGEIALIHISVLRNGVLPLLIGAAAAAAAASWAVLTATSESEGGVEPKNPGSLVAAIIFGALYAGVGVAMTLGRKHVEGSEWVVAAVSGLTDVDAVTLSTARMAKSGTLSDDLAWRLALTAAASNTLFKAALVSSVSRGALAMKVGLPLLILSGATAAIAAYW